MFFRLKNIEHVVTPQKLAKWLDCDYEGLFQAPKDWNPQHAWHIVSGRGTYDVHLSKSTRLVSLAMRILHRYITFSFNATKRSNGQVTTKDMLLTETPIKEAKVDTITS